MLALLPTAADNILEALPVESITYELQQQRQARMGESINSPSELSSSASGEGGGSLSSFQTGSYVHASQATGSSAERPESPLPKKTKAQLWGELKISSLTRSLTLIYTLALLTVLTRIQLNLLGRRSYVLSAVALASQKPTGPTISLENDEDSAHGTLGVDFETNRSFLAFSWWLLHRGWRDVMTRVESAVEEIFGPINPREEVSFERLSQMLLEVCKKVEGASKDERRGRKWLSVMLPPLDQEDFVLRESGVRSTSPTPAASATVPLPEVSAQSDTAPPKQPSPTPPMESATSAPLRRLLDESSDIIDSPQFTDVFTRIVDALLSELTDVAIRTQAYRLPEPAPSQSLTAAPSDVGLAKPERTKVKLANVLAVVTRQAHTIGNRMPNIYVQATEQVKELESLAVVIFSSDADLDEITKAREAGAQPSPRSSWEEEAPKQEEIQTGTTGSTWGMFENIWQKVAG